ncbi:hypothetical protein K2Q00_00320 [Patescibacteria group bacterium]|nr:hypothetical protein [Patescibacteria group bacterium]
MCKKFLVLTLAAFLLALSFSVSSAQQADCGANPTNPACLKHLQQPGTPTNCPDPRWYNIHQTRAGVVTLNIYDANGVQVNAANLQHSETKEAYDRFCISGHWLNKGHIFEWCTDDAGRVMSRDRMAAYANSSHVIDMVPSPGNLPNRPASLPKVQRQ